MEYKGSCHCKAIRFEFDGDEIKSGLRCNCSICKRKGATMTEYVIDQSAISFQATEGSLGVYEFGSCVAKHYFCKQCGIYPFHQSMSYPGKYRVNIGCIEGIDSSNLPFKVHDVASQ